MGSDQTTLVIELGVLVFFAVRIVAAAPVIVAPLVVSAPVFLFSPFLKLRLIEQF